ncbi:MAG: hypothetical protein LBP80_06170 [Treponema sp.]|jgi:hypothetical protein|nr:hypothetical protein [Treponema sp.]
MSGKHYIPAKESEFIEWSGNLIAGSTENKTLHDEAKALCEKCLTASYAKVDMETKPAKITLLLLSVTCYLLIEPVPKLIDCALNAHSANLRFDGTASITKAGRTELRIPICDTHPAN